MLSQLKRMHDWAERNSVLKSDATAFLYFKLQRMMQLLGHTEDDLFPDPDASSEARKQVDEEWSAYISAKKVIDGAMVGFEELFNRREEG